MSLSLYKYQKDAIQFAMQRKATYMMIDMGLGKTVIALKTIQLVHKFPALVFAPIKVAYNVWPNEIRKWTPHLRYVILHGPKKDKELSKLAHVYILPYSSLKWFYTRCCERKFKLRKFFMVYDESTYIKSWSTDRWSKYIRRMLPISSPYRMCLSGTPVPNGLVDLWTQYYVLDQGKTFGHYPTVFRDRFFHYIPPPANKTIIRHGSQNEIYRLIAPRTKRLDAKDYLSLPSTVYNNVTINVEPSLQKKYQSFRKTSVMEWDEGRAVTALNESQMSNKLRQFVQGAVYLDREESVSEHPYQILHTYKAEVLKEIITGLNGQPALVPIQFRFDYDIICRVFKRKIPVIRGGVSEKNAQLLINNWNASKLPILLCHPASIGHGVNLQHGGHNIIWYALPWSLDQFKQLNSRLIRIGQTKGVVINMLTMDFPIEKRVLNVLRNKNATQQDLLNAIKSSLFSS